MSSNVQFILRKPFIYVCVGSRPLLEFCFSSCIPHRVADFIRHLAIFTETSHTGKPDRNLSPNSLSEDDRRELISRQRNALYGDTPFSENGGLVEESVAGRSAAPGLPAGPSSHRGPSPLTYDYARGPGQVSDVQVPAPGDRSRTDNASPQSNPPTNMSIFDNTVGQQVSRTSNSSPGGSPPQDGAPSGKAAQSGSTVAPIGTRPSAHQPSNPTLNKRSTTPLPSPLSHGFVASSNADENMQSSATSGGQSNPSSAAPDGYNGWGNRWGNKSGLGVQASVWG